MYNFGLKHVLALEKTFEVLKNRSTPVISLIGIFLISVLFVGGVSATGDTAMFRFDPQHSGDFSSVAGNIPPNNQLNWSFETGDTIRSSPTVTGGVVYVGSYDDKVYAIDADTGNQIWSFETASGLGPGLGVYSSPAIANGIVYIGSDDRKVYAIDTVNGNQVWNFTTGSYVHSSPAVANGVVYVGSGESDGKVYAINAVTGNQIWSFSAEHVVPKDSLGNGISSSPAVYNGVVYVGAENGKVYAIDVTTGSQIWNFTTGYFLQSSPTVSDGIVYVGGGDCKVYAIDAATGNQIWTFLLTEIKGTSFSSPAVYNGVVYVGAENGKVYAIDATTGSQIWNFTIGYSCLSSPAVSQGVVYIGGDGKVYAINTATGDQIWNFTTGSSIFSSPAISNGVVYVGSDDGKIYAIGNLTPISAFSGNTTEGIAPFTVQFMDESIGAEAWAWDFGDGSATSTEQNPQHEYAIPGKYSVTLTITYGGGSETKTNIDYITVESKYPLPPFAAFSADITDGFAPLHVQFTDKSFYVQSMYVESWEWDFGDGSATSNEQNPSHVYTVPGPYSVTLTATNSLGTTVERKTSYIFVGTFTETLPPALEWQHTFGGTGDDVGYSIAPTPDGGYILTGVTYSDDGDVSGNNGDGDVWVVKLSTTGDLQWQRSYGGSSGDWGNSIVPTPDGGYILVGETFSDDNDVSGNHGNNDAWVVKLSTTGDLQWQRSYGGSNGDCGNSIVPTPDGGYIFAGVTQSDDGDVSGYHGNDHIYGDIWVVKINPNGDIQWQRAFGGSSDEGRPSIALTTDGGYIFTGQTNSEDGDVFGTYDAGQGQVWVVKLSNDGDLQWQHVYGGSNYDYGSGISLTPEGGYIITGQTSSEDSNIDGLIGQQDLWVLKLNTTGDLQWQRAFGGTPHDDFGYGISPTPDGGFILIGSESSGEFNGYNPIGYDIWVVKISATGDLQWQNAYGGFSDEAVLSSDDYGWSIAPSPDGGYILTGQTSWDEDNDSISNPTDVWVIKLAPEGQYAIANFKADITSGVAPLTVQFTDKSENAEAWEWDFGDGSTSNEQNPSHEFGVPGQYTVSLTITYGGVSNTKTKTDYITVLPGDQAPVAAFTSNPTSPTTADNIFFTDVSSDPDGTIVSYSWDFDGIGSSELQNPIFWFNTPGSHTVTLTVTDDFGDVSTTSQEIIVAEPTTGEATLDIPGGVIDGTELTLNIAIAGTSASYTGNEVTIQNNGLTTILTMTEPVQPSVDGIITGTIASIQVQSSPVTDGQNEAYFVADMAALPTDATITSSLTAGSGGSGPAFETAALDAGMEIVDVACTLTIVRVNIDDNDSTGIIGANIIMTAPESWVNQNGGPDAVKIIRIPDTGEPEILNTSYTQTGQFYTFTAYSPNGLSVFGLAGVRPVQTGTIVILKDSQGTGIAEANVSYYQGGWKSFGTTGADGSVAMQLSPDLAQVSFRVSYGGATLDKKQDVKTNPTVTFQTTLVTASLKDSSSAPVGTGTVTYYAGGWKDFGTLDVSGTVQKELLPGEYSFRISYAGASMDTKQNVTINPAVAFQTANVMVELRDSSGELITADNAGTVKYYAGGWRDFGMTTGGTCTKELLPLNYTFRMTYQGTSNDKAQDIGVNPIVVFQTGGNIATVRLIDSSGNGIAGGSVQYYAGGWKDFGVTGADGNAVKELLPGNYSFRMTYASGSIDKKQDTSIGPVTFQTKNVAVKLNNSTGQPIDTGSVQYYAGGWKIFGTTINGIAIKELLPAQYSFRMSYASGSIDKSQDISSDPSVIFQTGKVVSTSGNCKQYYAGGWKAFTNGIDLLPNTYKFRFKTGTPDKDYTITAGLVNTIQ